MNSPRGIPVVQYTLDGVPVSAPAAPTARLSEVLREQLGARDVKIGCNAGDCGACTVLVDGAPVCACLTPAHQVDGRRIETPAGLMRDDETAQALGARFAEQGAAQCGICTPGMITSAVALLRDTPHPSEEIARDALGGVLCRCTGYRKIIDAVCGAPTSVTDAPGEVGDAIARLDGTAKIAGTEAFADDIAPAGTLEILIIRSPHARARFTFGDLAAFIAATPGVSEVLTAADIPGRNAFGVIPQFVDQPVFAETEARFRGEAVAAIVGTPDAIVEFDPDTFPVDWEPLAPACDIDAARDAAAGQLHADRAGNIMCGGFVARGDAQAALERADVRVAGHFRSGFVEHAYIEPEAGFAELVNGRVEVHACTQAPVMDLEALEIILGMDRRRIRIIPSAVGGGFGSKLDISVQPYLALAALKTGKPVRLTYSRTESMQSTTKRHPSDIKLEIGATADGTICGFDFFGAFDTGAYASWGPTVATRVPVHASGPYRIADYRAESSGVHTNNPPAGAFRGFGVPQAAIAQECMFDVLAEKLGMDALAFRQKNALDNGDTTVCGQRFEQGVGIGACFRALAPAWDAAKSEAAAQNARNPVVRRGVGLAAGWYGCGNTSLPNPSTIKSGVRADGTVVLHQGAMDIGQGANTVIAQIFATALGVPVHEVALVGPDTDVTPDAGKTSASRQTYVSGNAARLSGAALRQSILQRLNVSDAAVLQIADGHVRAVEDGKTHTCDLTRLVPDSEGFIFRAEETYDPPTQPLDENGQGAPYAQFGYAAHLIVVDVDTQTGVVTPVRCVAAHDVGCAINPMLVEGQVHGGIAQGLGMALMEEYLPGRTENLHDYLIPTIGDVPPIETLIIEEPDAHGPFGAKGLGEHVLIPTAPAVLNAIYHATGARLMQVPATPDKVRAAIKGVGDAQT